MKTGIALLLILAATVMVVSSTAKVISLKSLKRLSAPVKKSCYSHDGIGVNRLHPLWGSAGESFPRLTPAAYTDNVKVPPRQKYSARELSNTFCKQEACDTSNKFGVNAMFYAFGQFIDHDIDQTGLGPRNSETFPIPVPNGDRFVNPISFTRSIYSSEKAIYAISHVNQVNMITAYMDASQIYGSDPIKANALRTLRGGLLKVNSLYGDEFLPSSFTHNGKFFSGGNNNSVIAGDDRLTESLPITVMQTLFLREHNRLARLVAKRFKFCKSQQKKKHIDEYIYQTARAINTAQIQSIAYKEYLPRLLGKYSPNPRKLRFNPNVQVTPSNEFATAAYRFGHSLVSCELRRVDESYQQLSVIEFKDAFNAFARLLKDKKEIDYVIRGLTSHNSQNLDEKIADGLRDFLFGPNVRLDLASNNIQRGRDHGLGSFNEIRKYLGLKELTSKEITSDSSLQTKLETYFGENLENLDPWLGILIERKKGNSQLGELGTTILRKGFSNLVEGDPCFFTNTKAKWIRDLKSAVEKVTLADIIAANTGIKRTDKTLGQSAFEAKTL